MSHALIAGGTGMLQSATIQIARQHRRTTLLCRHPDRFKHDVAPGVLSRSAVDFRDEDSTAQAIEAALERDGPCTTALLWLHSDAESSLRRIFAIFGGVKSNPRVVWILGSAAADPSTSLETRIAELGASPINLRIAILGYQREGPRSRWLTHDEISAGALKAWESQERITLVGETRPWSDRPSIRGRTRPG